jgi:hypothetical protein
MKEEDEFAVGPLLLVGEGEGASLPGALELTIQNSGP